MAAPRFLSDLAGTLRSTFRIGVNKLANIGGVLTSQTNAGVVAPIAASQTQHKATGGAGSVVLQAPAAQATDVTFTLPAADGSTDQAIVTNAAGVLSFKTVATGSNVMKSEDTTVLHSDSGAIAIVTLPAGATVQKIMVQVDVAFDGTGPVPSMSVGKSGLVSAYMVASDIDLSVVGEYEVACMVEEAGIVSPIVTMVMGGSHTVGSATVTVTWAVPG